jgi:hypothetical protein
VKAGNSAKRVALLNSVVLEGGLFLAVHYRGGLMLQKVLPNKVPPELIDECNDLSNITGILHARVGKVLPII